jgi:hypothetical protein
VSEGEDKIMQILGEQGWPEQMHTIFSGNVTVYPPTSPRWFWRSRLGRWWTMWRIDRWIKRNVGP